MKTLPAQIFALVLLGSATQALAQADESGADTLDSPSGIRCSALGELAEEERAGAVTYLAGYYDGERSATTIATVGASTEEAAETTASPEAAPAAGTEQDAAATAENTGAAADAANDTAATQGETTTNTGPSAAMLPTVPVEAVLAACAQSPDSRVVDIITAQGDGESQ